VFLTAVWAATLLAS